MPIGAGTFRKPGRPAPEIPAIEVGGPARLDAMADLIDAPAVPFGDAAPPEQGALPEVKRTVDEALALMKVPESALDTAFAMATAGIASSFPALPAAVIGLGVHVGVPHAHTHPPSLVPPAPPLPLPSIGTVMLAGAVSVLINGVPAARAGDIGIAVTCGSVAPPLEVVLGSSSVMIGGARAARVGDMTRHCNPMAVGPMAKAMGAASAAAAGADAVVKTGEAEAEADPAAAAAAALGAAMSAAQAAADTAALALQMAIGKDPGAPPGVGALTVGSANVLIGGFPCPNLADSARGLLRAATGLAAVADPRPTIEADVGAASCTQP